MSADNRTVTTDALETLGMIISENEKRDAIHLAVEPVLAGQHLNPGEHVSLKDGYAYRALDDEGLGIVDPFLVKPVRKGERFWFVVYPRQIKSLRHVWEHPAFPNSGETSAAPSSQIELSRQWIENFAASIPLKYEMLMDAAAAYVQYGEYLVLGGLLEGESVPDEFWSHYEIVKGIPINTLSRDSFFSCSC